MKKKAPLLLVLAALSATAFGLGATGCSGHQHTYESEWTRTTTEHYYAATCEHENEVKNKGNHDTDGEGGACSVCGYVAPAPAPTWTITYVSAHGTAPAAATNQTKLPDTLPVLTDDDYEFGGWYLDEACTEATKATAGSAISAATTLYAKWTPKSVTPTSWTITYVSDHGTTPQVAANQTKLPDTLPVLEDGAFDFGGWYLDEACTEANKATAGTAITAATTLYAKWTAKIGSTAENPIELSALGTPALTTLMNGNVYFKYTATKAGRYTVSTMALGEVTAVSADDDNAKVVKEEGVGYHLTLAEGKSVIITVGKGEAADNAKVSAVVNECTNEPLPEEGWEEGVYSDMLLVQAVEFKRDGTLKFNGSEDPESYYFVGGDVNEISWGSTTKYTATYSVTEDGEKQLTIKSGSSKRVLTLEVEQTPIGVAEFSGDYEPANEEKKAANINLFRIYADGTGYYVFADDKGATVKNKVDDATYSQKINRLIWGSYVITLNSDDNGNAKSITVYYETYGEPKTITYNRIGESGLKPPKSLPLPATPAEYRGATYGIQVVDGATQRYNSGIYLDISDYDGEYYTIIYKYLDDKAEVVEDNYKIKIVTEGEDIVIEWYDMKGAKLDALVRVAPTLHELPAEGFAGIEASEFEDGCYFFKANESGVYKISVEAYDPDTGESCDAKAVYNVLAYDYDGTGMELPESGVVQLEAGAIIKVTADANAYVSFKCVKQETGMLESKPIVLENGLGAFENTTMNTNYYFTFTAPKAGKYAVLCSAESYGYINYEFYYSINGEDCGYDINSWEWYEGYSEYKPYAVIDVPADNLTLKIVVNLGYRSAEILNVKVLEAVEHKELTLDDNNEGKLTASGSYICSDEVILADEDLASFVLKSDGTMKVTVTAIGKEYTGKVITLTKEEIGFGITIECASEVNYAFVAKFGSEANPHIITELGATVLPFGGFVSITAPSDKAIKIELGEVYFYGEEFINAYFVYDDKYYSNYEVFENNYGSRVEADGTYLTVAAGKTVLIEVNDVYGQVHDIPLIITEDFASIAEELTFNDGTPSEGKLISVATATVTGTKIYKIADTAGAPVVVTASVAFSFTYADGTVAAATEEAGVYSLTIAAGKNIAFKATAEGELTFTATYPEGTAKYPFGLTFENGSFTAQISETTSYKFGEAGSYLLGADASYKFNGENLGAGSVIEAEADDVLTVMPSGEGKFTVSIAVPSEFKGKYGYGTDGATLAIGNNTVTIGEKTYVLTAISNNTYTFTYTSEEGEAETIALTLDGEECKFGENTLTYLPMFTAEQAVEYTGTYYGYTYTLTLNQDGTGTLTIDYGFFGSKSYEIEVTETADGYAFDDYTFTFDEDGNVILNDYITLYAPGNGPVVSGTVYSNKDGIKLTISDGTLGNVVEAVYFDSEGWKNDITIYETATPGVYEYDNGMEPTDYNYIAGTITVIDENTVQITDNYGGNHTLTKN